METSNKDRCVLVLLCALSAWFCSCGSVPQLPIERAISGARAVSNNGVKTGLGAVEDSAPFELELRYNPVTLEDCSCPEFEVHYSGAWHRVYVRGSDEVLLTLRARAQRLSGVDQSVKVFGAPTRAKQSEGLDGQEYSVFELESLP